MMPPPLLSKPRRTTLTFIGSVISNADGTGYNFGSFAIPRKGLLIAIFAGVVTTTNAIFSGANIAGAAARAWDSFGAVANPTNAFVQPVAAGSHNVSVTASQSLNRAAVGVWLLEDYAYETTLLAYARNRALGTGLSGAPSAEIPPQAFGLYVSIHRTTGASTWSGPTPRSGGVSETSYFNFADYELAKDLDFTTPAISSSWAASASYSVTAWTTL